MMKKYYRSRYSTFLKTLIDQKQKKEADMDKLKEKEEKKKSKL